MGRVPVGGGWQNGRMWKRPAQERREPGPSFGVGVQVHVEEPSTEREDDWTGEPTGVIVSNGAPRPDGLPISSRSGPIWLVAFDEPQYRRDGRGPFTEAAIPQSRLVAAEPMEY